MDNSKGPTEHRIQRREFLANLFFCGGVLTVSALQSEYGLLARRDPEEDGWELPKDEPPSEQETDWELPDDLLQTTPPPPEPRPDGGIRPPIIRGRVAPPKPNYPGDVAPPKQ